MRLTLFFCLFRLRSLCFLSVCFITFCYVGVGCYLNMKQDKRGVEACPNYEFWADLPSLLKDGCTFFTSPCRGGGYGRV